MHPFLQSRLILFGNYVRGLVYRGARRDFLSVLGVLAVKICKGLRLYESCGPLQLRRLLDGPSRSMIYPVRVITGGGMAKVRILIVEDNEDNQELMRFLLERAGYDVISVENGLEGVKTARREKPDIILMDLSLPELDGWSAARQIKADPEIGNIPMIAVTAHTLPGDRRKALDAGFDSYISKPINIHMFDITVGKVLEQKQHPNNT
jgi:CheY-like chemotaxis protein